MLACSRIHRLGHSLLVVAGVSCVLVAGSYGVEVGGGNGSIFNMSKALTSNDSDPVYVATNGFCMVRFSVCCCCAAIIFAPRDAARR